MGRIALHCGSAVLWMSACALLVWRWCVPVESAVRGDTLGTAVLWCALAALAGGLCCARGGSRERRAVRKSRCATRLLWMADAGLAALIAGHICGAAWLALHRAGDVRAAVNLVAEWLGIGAAWWTFRALWHSTGAAALVLRRGALLIAALAGLGIWQHWVWYDQVARTYLEVRQRLDRTIERSGAESPAARRLREQLLQMGVPPESLHGRARTLFELRLRDSREPLGFFALANSFAGLLLCGLFWMVPFLRTAKGRWPGRARTDWMGALLGWGGLALTAYCLLLTKSRTAWLGAVCAFGWLGGAFFCARRWSRGGTTAQLGVSTTGSAAERASGSADARHGATSRRATVVALAAGGVLLGVAIATGGLDAEVLWQAPKSVRYRVEYWTATLRMMSEHWLWGIGPGTFQTAYLEYKLPGSSEEIADPHNLFLDAWANAGMLGLIGIAALAASGALLAWRLIRGEPDTPGTQDASATCGVRGARRPSPGTCGGGNTPWAASIAAAPAAEHLDRLIVAGMVVGVFGPAAEEWLGGADWSGQRLAVMFGWLGAVVCSRWAGGSGQTAGVSIADSGQERLWPSGATAVNGSRPSRTADVAMAAAGAFLALLVHLCGAGGLEMPGFAITWLLCLLASLVTLRWSGLWGREVAADEAAGSGRGGFAQQLRVARGMDDSARSCSAANGGAMRWERAVPWVAAVLWASAAVWAWQYAYRPVRTAGRAIREGDRAWLHDGNGEAARRAWLAAADADPLAVEPWLRIARLESARAEQVASAGSALAALQQAERALHQALRRDPRRYATYWELARVHRLRLKWLERAETQAGAAGHPPASGERLAEARAAARRAALQAYRRAVKRYPTHTELLAEFALFADAVGEAEAAVLAREALACDRLNRDAGHVDRLLTPETLRRLQAVARKGQPRPD